MKIKDIKELTVEQMEIKIVELKKELLTLRFQQATGDLENTAQINKVKKDIARIKTVINEKQ